MNKLNRDIVNIINNYIKPLCYLKELEESIKDIKYNKVFYYSELHVNLKFFMNNSIFRKNNKWYKDESIKLDYRLKYLLNKI